jgi:hypothetical protein
MEEKESVTQPEVVLETIINENLLEVLEVITENPILVKEKRGKKMPYKYRIYRNPEGISLNGKEFICEDNGDIMFFDTIGMAQMWVKKQDSTINIDVNDMMSEYGLDIEEHSPENGYYELELKT